MAGEDWKVIDPHGYVGDKVSEVGSMIYNPLEWYPEGSMKKAIARRLDILCEELPFEGGQVVPPHELAIAEALSELIS